MAESLGHSSAVLAWEGWHRSRPSVNISYLVQWKYADSPGDWEYFDPGNPLSRTTVNVTGLRPYTKYLVSALLDIALIVLFLLDTVNDIVIVGISADLDFLCMIGLFHSTSSSLS